MIYAVSLRLSRYLGLPEYLAMSLQLSLISKNILPSGGEILGAQQGLWFGLWM